MDIINRILGLGKRQNVTQYLETRQKIYADFNQNYKSEMDLARKKAIDNLRIAPGQDPFFAMGAATQAFGQSSEPKRIYEKQH